MNLRRLSICILVSAFSFASAAIAGVPPTFDDADKTPLPSIPAGAPNLYQLPFPRISLTEGSAGRDIEVSSKYKAVSYSTRLIQSAAELRLKYPSITILRYFPAPYDPRHPAYSRPFDSSGPASVGSAVFPGHWMYLAGSTLAAPIGSSDLVLQVADPTRFTAGQYVVIYDGGPGAFTNGEHAKIQAVDTRRKTVTLVSRGYKSTPKAHVSGAVVAQHWIGAAGTLGATAAPESWIYNYSTACPRDANGNQMNVVMADWLGANLDLDGHGQPVGDFHFDGVLFDGERQYFYPIPNTDMDNDLVAEAGLSRTGENMYGPGIETLYARLRSVLGPTKILVSSNGYQRGFKSVNGAQCEGYPVDGSSYLSPPPYTLIGTKFASYSYHIHDRAYGPVYTEVLSKMPTLLYPNLDGGGSPPTSNAPFRFSFGLALLDDGFYGQHRPGYQPWWDEYSVDVTAGSPTFGQAIPNDDSSTTQIAKVRKHTGWLGFPLGPRTRVFDPAQFDVTQTLLTNPGFERGLGGWTGIDVTLSSGTPFAGKFSLKSSPMINYAPDVYAASIESPVVRSSTPDTYTVCFAVKSSAEREFSVQFGTGTPQLIHTGTDWKSHTLVFRSDAGANKLKFYVGRENSGMSFDEVYVFKGNADVFRRDFQNGTVFVNATANRRTINTGGNFRRIKGTQDPVNDGSNVGPKLTLPEHDAAVLLRLP